MKNTILKRSFCLIIFYTGLLYIQLLPAQQLLIEHQLQAPGIYPPDADDRIELADMDGDGDLDLIANDLASYNALVYLNQNGKMDSIPQVIETDLEAQHYRLADWNADGHPDFLIQTSNNNCYLRINHGALVFGSPMFMPLVRSIEYIRVHDLNGDGFVDLVDAGSVFENLNGSPVTHEHVLPSQDSYDNHLCDLDGDGVQELVQTYSPNGAYSALKILRETGNFDFVLSQTIDFLGDAGSFVHPVDLDNDQRSELIYLSNPGNWRIIKEISPGQYSDELIGTSQAVGTLNSFFFAYDVDNNGYKDVIIGNDIFMNNQFTFNKIPAPNRPFPNAVLADTDSDGLVEAYWVTLPARIQWTEYVANGVFQPYKTLVEAWQADETVTAMDIENDGDIDFLYFSYHTDYLILSKNDNGVYSESILNANDIFPFNFLQFDYNGDGFQDFMAARVMFVNDGQGHFASPRDSIGQLVGLPIGFPVGAADFNNDGLDDVVLSQKDALQQPFMTFYINTGNGFVQIGQAIPGGVNLNSFWECKFKDLNGDGWKEMILVRSGDFFVYQNHGGDFFEQGFRGFGDFVGFSDMNGDSKEDLIYRDPAGVWMVPNFGNGNFGPRELRSSPPEGFYYPFGIMTDVTGDGLDDIIVEWQNAPGYAVMVNEGFSFSKAVYQGPLKTYYAEILKTPLLDFDQDGDLDICLAGQYSNEAQRFGWLENISNSPNKIAGNVFFDANGDGLKDVGESPASGIKLGLDSLGSFAVSDSFGQFCLPTGAATGDFTVKIIPPAGIQFNITSPGSLQASISSTNPKDTTLIGLRISGVGASLDQALSSHRCNESARLWIPFMARTNGPAFGELRLILPDGLVWQDMDSLPGVVRQGQEIRWPLSQIPTLTDQVVWVDFVMPNFQFIGDTLLFASELLLFNGTDSVLLRDTMFELLTCAYDPNDKLIANVERFYVGDEYYALKAPEPVEYLIRFQNTGNDTAKQVVILDNLSSLFDYNSLQVLGSSHSCRVNLDFSGLMRIEFSNINLPDSSANFIGSMGFVKFSISLKSNPPRNKPIRNNARILFDQNPPVLTKLASFRIVDCNYFTEVSALPNGICEGDTVSLNIPTHGLEQNYAWSLNNTLVSSSNSATFQVTQYQNMITLTLNNGICQTDTSIYFYSSGAYPDLQLSVDSSAAFCTGTSLEITSNFPVKWYQDGTQVSFGLTYVANTSQTLLAETYTYCASKKTVYLTEVQFPDKLILEGDPTTIIIGCPGDSVIFNTVLEKGNWLWTLYDFSGAQVADSFKTSSFGASIDEVPNGSVHLVLDTLNCSLEEYRIFQRIPEGSVRITGDSVVCFGTNYAFIQLEIGGINIPFDSLFLFKDNQLVQVSYQSFWAILYPIVPGDYTLVVFSPCSVDTIQRTFYDMQSFLTSIQVGSDTLFSENGQVVIWLYAPSLDSVFLPVGDPQAFLANLSTGYYFMSYTAGNCYVNSDTVFVQSTRVINPLNAGRIEIFPNPNSGTFKVKFPAMSKPGMSFRIIGLAGQVGKEQSTLSGNSMQTVQTGDLPAGLYFLQVLADGKVLAVEKFVKQ